MPCSQGKRAVLSTNKDKDELNENKSLVNQLVATLLSLSVSRQQLAQLLQVSIMHSLSFSLGNLV
jgi:hypothetical protein